MPAIQFGGMASGLPPNIVDQLVEAERIPIKNMETKKAKSENRLKLVNELDEGLNKIKESIGTLASVRGFQDYKLSSGDQNIIGGTVDPNSAASGSWNVEVVELAQKAAAITNGFPDKDRTEIGTGYFRFETPEGYKEVYLKGNNSTLEGAVAAINSANIGVRASIINDRKDEDRPFKLMLSGENVGGSNKIEYPSLYFLDGDQDLYFDEEREAKNGLIKVDGFEFEVDSNQITDIIPGVTIDLRQAAPGRQVNISVNEDREVVGGKVKEFIDAINGVLGFIQSQNTLNESSDTTSTLGGDGLLRSIENRLRTLLQGTQVGISGPVRRLNQLGIEFNRKGLLDFSQEKFDAALASNPDAVQQFFAGDGFSVGFIPSIRRTIATVQDQVFGPVTVRKKALQSKIRQIDDRIDQKERQLDKKEKSLRRKFANLETQMSRLKSQMGQVGALGGGGQLIPGLG
ncbi:MAG: flagellar filament capping protein FliD [Bdellovibrionales bacterium]